MSRSCPSCAPAEPAPFSFELILTADGGGLRSFLQEVLATPSIRLELPISSHRPLRPDPPLDFGGSGGFGGFGGPWLATIVIRPFTPTDQLPAAAVPEPSAALCFAIGLAAAAGRLRRRARRSTA